MQSMQRSHQFAEFRRDFFRVYDTWRFIDQGLTQGRQDAPRLAGELQTHGRLFAEMFLCRLVDVFETYVSDILRAAFRKWPEILKGDDQVELARVLCFANLDEFFEDLFERQVMTLCYGGLETLRVWCEERLGLDIAGEATTWRTATEAVEVRNAIVHNHGRVGPKFLSALRDTEYAPGDVVVITVENFNEFTAPLAKLAGRIDRIVVDKFGLECVAIDTTREPDRVEVEESSTGGGTTPRP